MHAHGTSRSHAHAEAGSGHRTRRLRLVTYNIAHARGWMPHQGLVTKAGIRRNLDRIAEVLRALRPDLVALQEIDSDSLWNGRFDHVAYLSERTGLQHAAFGASNDVAHASGRMRLCYGNALLSRHPIVTAETLRFGTRRIGEKGLLYAEVNWEGSVLPVVCLHLHHSSRAQRLDQSSQMLDLLERRLSSPPHSPAPRLPVIVAGDFNCAAHRSGDAACALLSHGGALAGHHAIPPHTRTFPSLRPTRMLDYWLIPAKWRVLEAHAERTRASDHLPIVIEVEVPEG
jgi:endonuclease/exonuclease/phosphatase family metal-dependent hydrolase